MKWFRLWVDILDDPKLSVSVTLPETFRATILLMAYARELNNAGKIDQPEDVIAWRLRMGIPELKKHLKHLSDLKIITLKPEISFINWGKRQFLSDTSTERVKRFRIKKRNVSKSFHETAPDTDTEADTDPELKTGTTPSGCRKKAPKNGKNKGTKNVYSTAVCAYRDVFKLTPKPDERQIIDMVVIGEHSVAKWSEIMTKWKGRKFGPFNITGMLQVFKRGWVGENGNSEPKGLDAVREWARKEGINLDGDETSTSGSHEEIDAGILG